MGPTYMYTIQLNTYWYIAKCVYNTLLLNTNYNMTVWILAGNYISFTIAAGLIRLHMPGVKKSRV